MSFNRSNLVNFDFMSIVQKIYAIILKIDPIKRSNANMAYLIKKKPSCIMHAYSEITKLIRPRFFKSFLLQ